MLLAGLWLGELHGVWAGHMWVDRLFLPFWQSECSRECWVPCRLMGKEGCRCDGGDENTNARVLVLQPANAAQISHSHFQPPAFQPDQ